VLLVSYHLSNQTPSTSRPKAQRSYETRICFGRHTANNP
jgi:hypothetical protein